MAECLWQLSCSTFRVCDCVREDEYGIRGMPGCCSSISSNDVCVSVVFLAVFNTHTEPLIFAK